MTLIVGTLTFKITLYTCHYDVINLNALLLFLQEQVEEDLDIAMVSCTCIYIGLSLNTSLD